MHPPNYQHRRIWFCWYIPANHFDINFPTKKKLIEKTDIDCAENKHKKNATRISEFMTNGSCV